MLSPNLWYLATLSSNIIFTSRYHLSSGPVYSHCRPLDAPQSVMLVAFNPQCTWTSRKWCYRLPKIVISNKWLAFPTYLVPPDSALFKAAEHQINCHGLKDKIYSALFWNISWVCTFWLVILLSWPAPTLQQDFIRYLFLCLVVRNITVIFTQQVELPDNAYCGCYATQQ